MSIKKRLGAIIVLLAMLMGLAGTAQASTVTETTSWWGKTRSIYFNKSETARIASGAGACAGVAGRVPGGIPTGVATACTVLAAYAGIAVATNSCVGIAYMYSKGIPYPNLGHRGFYHNKGYCR